MYRGKDFFRGRFCLCAPSGKIGRPACVHLFTREYIAGRLPVDTQMKLDGTMIGLISCGTSPGMRGLYSGPIGRATALGEPLS